MLKTERKGFVGLMLTIALGVAVGAATLVAGGEAAKNLASPKKPAAQVASPKILVPSNPQGKSVPGSKAESAADKFMKTQKNYYQSIIKGQGDAKTFSQEVKDAQTDFEQAKKGLKGNIENQGSAPLSGTPSENLNQRNPFLESDNK